MLDRKANGAAGIPFYCTYVVASMPITSLILLLYLRFSTVMGLFIQGISGESRYFGYVHTFPYTILRIAGNPRAVVSTKPVEKPHQSPKTTKQT